MRPPPPPNTEMELMHRAEALVGVRLCDIAESLGLRVPIHPLHAKGWAGQLIESALGASAGSLPEPDFQRIGVELKTIPVRRDGTPRESTYVCMVPLVCAENPVWHASNVLLKLSRVLWMPIVVDDNAAIAERTLGFPLLWSPTAEEEADLRADWEELMDFVYLGQVETITAHHGTHLQIRPKAADSHARRGGIDEHGAPVATLPRGFYLRPSFTGALLARHFLIE